MRTITFILNGEDHDVTVRDSTPLYMARNVALEETGNYGRPSNEWDIYTERGDRLSPLLRADTYASGVRLFLSLQAGAGGCDRRAA
jgi:hypothetical protein